MTLLRLAGSLLAAGLLAAALGAGAEEHPASLHIHDAYARVSGGIGASGAVFFMIHNGTEADLVITGATSPQASKAGLHTHVAGADGMMQMLPIEGGVALPAGVTHSFERGADHVMLMGLTEALADGASLTLILTFDAAPPLTVTVPIDNARQPGAVPMQGH